MRLKSKQNKSNSIGGFMNRDIKITKAGYLYINGKKASPRRITPLYVGADILDPDEQEITPKWANTHYEMVNN